MLFTSWAFAILVAVFVPVYYLVPKKLQWIVLLLANFVFYSFAGLTAVAFLLLTVAAVYAAGRGLDRSKRKQEATLQATKGDWSKEQRKAYRQRMERKRRTLVALCLVFCFGILFTMKFGPAALRLVGLERLGERIVMTMGISFYLFSTVSYLLDVHRGTVPCERNPLRLLLFSSFFPLLVQGPICRYGALTETLFSTHRYDGQRIKSGLLRIAWGYLKKLVVADRLLVAVKTLISAPDTYDGAFVLLLMLLYAACLYADFTGGIDITIGVGELFGVRIAENFLRPYFSKSISEYWRRWHITLGAWFREYLYYPLSVSKPMRWLTRTLRPLGTAVARRVPVYLSTLLVWAITGIWHGSSWNFLVWGLLNGAIILISEECSPLYQRFTKRFPRLRGSWGYRAFTVVRTVLLLSALRLFDCYPSVGQTFRSLGSLFMVWNAPLLFQGGIASLGLSGYDYLAAGMGVVLMFAVSLLGRTRDLRQTILSWRPWAQCAVFAAMIVMILLFGYYGFGFDAGQFIYNRF